MGSMVEEWAGIWELREEVRALQRANTWRESRTSGTSRRLGRPRRSRRSRRQARRRLWILLGTVLLVVAAATTLSGGFRQFPSHALPSRASLARLSVRGRIVAIATSQVGYRTTPTASYCNRFSAYWHAGTAAGCPGGRRSEQWCADFAAWVWHTAGVRFTYGYEPGQLNAGAISFYAWGVEHARWHPATRGYVAAPGDVAVYGLSLGAAPSAVHVAIVTDDPRGQPGPDVINGDGDRTGHSAVETGTDQVRADTAHRHQATLAGYVSP